MANRCRKFTLVLLTILVNNTVGSQFGHHSSVQANLPRSRLCNTSAQHKNDAYHLNESIIRYRAGAVNIRPRKDDSVTEMASIEKRGLAVVQLSSLLSILSTTLVAFTPAAALVQKLGDAKATSLLSILAASSAIIEILFSPAVGRLMDDFGRKRPLLTVLVAIAMSQLTVVLSNESTWSLCVGKFAGTLGIGFFFQTIGQAILTDVTGRGNSPERLSSALGMQAALISIGFLVGALSAGKLQATFGVTTSYGIASILAFANAILVALVMPETLEASATKRQVRQRKSILGSLLSCIDILIKRQNGIPVLAATFALQSLPQFMGDFFQIFCKAEWNLDTAAFSQFVAMFGVLGLVSNISGSLLVRRLGIRRFTILTTLLAIVPSFCVSVWGFQGLLAGYAFGFLGLAQNLGIMSALASEGKKQNIPIGEITGERASLMGLVKILGPILYSTLYVQGKRLWGLSNLPFIFNTVLGIAVFALSYYHVK
ncbi:unnamed protein product [Cylindrotheca closterium]|uniref:Major facilitator superfamily (MFS) profile domain-containing protein n=1 Tax=Cylindrotheca closterium TaxID=2856 RepID=A0AAD2FRA3_9STRA|nr:unnamed protein product [Cylindrotheca closterium]